MRGRVEWAGVDEAVAVVAAEAEVEVEEEDWGGLSQGEQEERLERYLVEDQGRGFDLGQAPLMRVCLVRKGEGSYEMVWSFHHVMLDGWSVPVVLKEVFRQYEGFRRGEELRLGPAPRYGDYVGWLRAQDMQKAEAYWRRRLKGFGEPSQLRVGRAEGGERGGYETEAVRLSAEATARLQGYVRREGLTLNTLAHGGWAMLVWRYSGEGDV